MMARRVGLDFSQSTVSLGRLLKKSRDLYGSLLSMPRSVRPLLQQLVSLDLGRFLFSNLAVRQETHTSPDTIFPYT